VQEKVINDRGSEFPCDRICKIRYPVQPGAATGEPVQDFVKSTARAKRWKWTNTRQKLVPEQGSCLSVCLSVCQSLSLCARKQACMCVWLVSKDITAALAQGKGTCARPPSQTEIGPMVFYPRTQPTIEHVKRKNLVSLGSNNKATPNTVRMLGESPIHTYTYILSLQAPYGKNGS
jgi:hypothetical protein